MLNKLSAYAWLMRLHKPIGILLLLWPTLWALWIAGKGHPHWHIVAIFIAGVIVMRSAGCIINDIADINFDKYVKRTANRPLTSGDVSLKEALLLFIILLGLALLLVLQLNFFTFKLAIIALVLACFYPFTKRWTHWPQLFLGAAFAMSVPMAYAALTDHLPLTCWLIYTIAILWPLMYDTEYAMADREDDVKIGIKSTAIYFGRFDIIIITLLQIILLALLGVLGWLIALKIPYYLALLLVFCMFCYQLSLLKKECYLKAFLNNQWVGLVIFLGILVSF